MPEQDSNEELILARLQCLVHGLKKYAFTTKDFYKIQDAILEMAEKFNLAECESCGEFFDIDTLEVYEEEDTNSRELICRKCVK